MFIPAEVSMTEIKALIDKGSMNSKSYNNFCSVLISFRALWSYITCVDARMKCQIQDRSPSRNFIKTVRFLPNSQSQVDLCCYKQLPWNLPIHIVICIYSTNYSQSPTLIHIIYVKPWRRWHPLYFIISYLLAKFTFGLLLWL